MAKVVAKKKQVEGIVVGKKSIYIFFGGLLTLIISFVLMAQPPVDGFLSKTLAPILLVIAYLLVFPISIFAKDKPVE